MDIRKGIRQALLQTIAFIDHSLRGRPAFSSRDIRYVRDFLFLQYVMPLGCCVHDTPIYEALRRCLPAARITVATRGLGYDTLRHNPHIDRLIRTGDPLKDTWGVAKELSSSLRENGMAPDCVITNSSNQRTRLTLLNMLIGRNLRLGYTLSPALYHVPLVYDKTLSLIANNLRLTEQFGCGRAHYEPQVYFGESELESVRALLRECGLSNCRPRVAMVTQNSGGQKTGWHAGRFAKVIRHVAGKLGCDILFVGTASDAGGIDSLREQAGNGSKVGFSLAGKTSIPQISALLCICDYAISLDTGPMHVGRAAGLPMVVLGPSWQKPLEWLPLGIESVRILRGDTTDHAPANYMLDEIEADQVIGAVEELMTLYPASEMERAGRVKRSLSVVDHSVGDSARDHAVRS